MKVATKATDLVMAQCKGRNMSSD